MTFDCCHFKAQGEVVEVVGWTELPLARRRGRSILQLDLGAVRVGGRIERASYVHYPWCGILEWVAIFCIGHELPYFVYGMSCHCIDIGNDVPFFTSAVYDWKFVYINISFCTFLYYFSFYYRFAYIMSNVVVVYSWCACNTYCWWSLTHIEPTY